MGWVRVKKKNWSEKRQRGMENNVRGKISPRGGKKGVKRGLAAETNRVRGCDGVITLAPGGTSTIPEKKEISGRSKRIQ